MPTTFEQELAWTTRHMPLVQRQVELLPDLRDMRIACAMHLDIKMTPFIDGLLDKGAGVFICTCNPTTVRDEVVRHVAERGADTHAWNGMSEADRDKGMQLAMHWRPTHLCEMGADLTAAYQAMTDDRPTIQASLEATGSGISRLGDGPFEYPIYNWDDLPIKEGLHNRYMVGLTACHTFFNCTQLTLHNRSVLVVGYGSVGRGVAEAARSFGGSVAVAERDPNRAVEARFAGWPVVDLDQGLAAADVVITATGVPGVIGAPQFPHLRDGCFLLNVGHVANEFDVPGLYQHGHQTVLPYVEEVKLPGKSVFVIADGSMANLTAGKGDSLNAFDITLAVLVAGVRFIVTDGSQQEPGLYMLPDNVWQSVVTA